MTCGHWEFRGGQIEPTPRYIHVESSRSCPHDVLIAKVEELAGFDGEVPADLHPLNLVFDGRKADDAVQRARDQCGQRHEALGVCRRTIPVVRAIDIGHEARVGRQFGRILLAPALSAWAGRDDKLEMGSIFREGLPVGPDEPCPRLATYLEANRQLATSLFARKLDRHPPLVFSVEDMDTRSSLRGEPMHFKPAVAHEGLLIPTPEGVGRFDEQRREKGGVDYRLTVGPLNASFDCKTAPERCGDLMGLIAGSGLIRDDRVSVVALTAGFILVESI
jgi:hypothetical protein